MSEFADEEPTYSQEIRRQKGWPPITSGLNTVRQEIEEIRRQGYELYEEIGHGKFSTVFRATSTHMPGVTMACKQIITDDVDKEWKDKCLDRELTIATKLKYKKIIEVYEAFKSPKVVFIFMRMADNGSIRDYMTKNERPVKEIQAKIWWCDLMAGLAYMHAIGMAHRDIKLENCLLDDQFIALLSDFGFAVYDETRPQKLLKKTICGTIDYMAPEVCNASPKAPYDAKMADIYSMGVCIFEMLNYDRPFDSNLTLKESIALKMKRSYRFHLKIDVILSDSIKDLIRQLLEPDPKIRISIQKILKHKALDTGSN